MTAYTAINTGTSLSTIESLVQQLYVAYFNRPADPAGLTFWQSHFMNADSAVRYQETARLFATSAEYSAQYQGLSNPEIIDRVYQNLFGRHAEPAGLLYWSNLLDRHAIHVDNVVTQVAAGAQGSDLVSFKDKTQGAVLFSRALDTPEKVAYYAGPKALEVSKAFISSIVDDASLAALTTPEALQQMIDYMYGNLPTIPTLVPGLVHNEPAADAILSGANSHAFASDGMGAPSDGLGNGGDMLVRLAGSVDFSHASFAASAVLLA